MSFLSKIQEVHRKNAERAQITLKKKSSSRWYKKRTLQKIPLSSCNKIFNFKSYRISHKLNLLSSMHVTERKKVEKHICSGFRNPIYCTSGTYSQPYSITWAILDHSTSHEHTGHLSILHSTGGPTGIGKIW
jgi:hypothetical protein